MIKNPKTDIEKAFWSILKKIGLAILIFIAFMVLLALIFGLIGGTLRFPF